MIHKLISNFLGLIYTIFFKINWFKVIKYYNRKSTNIVWICPIFPSKSVEYLLRSTFIGDLSIIYEMYQREIPFRIVLGKKIGKVVDCNIFYSISYHFNYFSFVNYAENLNFIIKSLEAQQNKLFPNSKEALYWENKSYMHKMFDKLEVNAPKTIIVDHENTEVDTKKLVFPLLWKDVHSSGAMGIYKLNNLEAYEKLRKEKLEKGHDVYLLQQLVNMHKDFRVTVVGNEIIHHYWRINPSEEWKPTSTSHGSSVDFDFFPEKWREDILDCFKKFEISAGAFDITWDNDDLNNKPLILEISPSFDINPPQPKKYANISYKKYKRKYFIKDSYYKGRVDMIFYIKKKTFDYIYGK